MSGRLSTPPCINVDHLFLGNVAENAADMTHKGRGRVGCRNGLARLSEAVVREARLLADGGVPHAAIARQFGVHKSTVTRAVRGETWSHVA